MKTRVSVSLLVGMLALGCGGAPAPEPQPPAPSPAPTQVAAADQETPPAPETPDQAARIELIKKMYSEMSAGKVKLDGFADDAELNYVDPVGPAQFAGKDAIKGHLEEMLRSTPDFRVVPVKILVLKPDFYLVESLYGGTNTGPNPGGAPSTGKPYGSQIAQEFHFQGDKIKKFNVWFNQMVGAVQMGMMPPISFVPPIPPIPTSPPEVIEQPGDSAALEILVENQNRFARQDLSFFDKAFTPDVAFGLHPNPKVTVASAKKFNAMMNKAMKHEGLTIDWKAVVGDTAVVAVTHKAKHIGPIGKIPATNKSLTRKYLEVSKFRDGRIAHARVYSNPLSVFSQLGLLPKPKPAKK